MNQQKKLNPIFSGLLCLVLLCSCNSDSKEKSDKDTVAPVILKKDKPTPRNEPAKNAPIINITDTIAIRYNVIYVKDSALNSVRLSQKLAQIYGVKMADVIKKNKLKIAGAPMAWYKSQKAPFFFEAGLPVDKKPAKLPKNILFKKLNGDSALVAHYYGPYEETSQAYDALKDWLKSAKKKSTSPPYEIYVGDPIDKNGKPVDPYRVQTDIVFPHN